jgi:hypothetical protein
MPNDPLLVGIVTRRAGDASPWHKRKDYDQPLFRLLHGFERLLRRFHEKMLVKKNTWHGRVAAPAKEPDIGPESDRIRPVRFRIRLSRMTQEAYRLSVNLAHAAGVSQHDVGIDVRVLFSIMALETDRPSVRVRPSPEQFRGSFMIRSAVYLMTGEAPDLAVEKRKRHAGRIGRREKDRMVVYLVVMTVETEG